MELKLINDQGAASATFNAPDEVFGREFNQDLVHQIVIAYQANARMGTRELKDHCALDESVTELLKLAMEQYSLSARAYDRILKVARTIADLEGAENIQSQHILEAIQYRSLDRKLFS